MLPCKYHIYFMNICRAVVSGGAEVTLAPPEFDRSINPFQTRRADYAPHTILLLAPPPDSKCYLHLWTIVPPPMIFPFKMIRN